MDNMDKELLDQIKEVAPDGAISCQAARELAEKLGIQASQVGKVCTQANIKIYACELGCF